MRKPTFARLFDTDPGLPPPTPAPAPTPAPGPARTGRVTCEGCGCSLDAQGQIIARGDGLRAFIAREDEVARMQKELDAKDEQIAELSARVRELSPAPRKSVLW